MTDLLDLQHRLEQMTRERDELAVLAELSDGYRRERDEAREEWATRRCECSASDFCAIAKERDEARAQLAAVSSLHGALAAINAMAREREEARAALAELAPKVFIAQLERGEIRHVAYVAGGFYTREAIAEWAKKALGFERADEIRRLTLPDHKHFPPMAGGEPR